LTGKYGIVDVVLVVAGVVDVAGTKVALEVTVALGSTIFAGLLYPKWWNDRPTRYAANLERLVSRFRVPFIV
jgi:hypothetical protein